MKGPGKGVAALLMLAVVLVLRSPFFTALFGSLDAAKLARLARFNPEATRKLLFRRGMADEDTLVEEACDGWLATVNYCGASPTEDRAAACLCSSTALERLDVCTTALSASSPSASSSLKTFASRCPVDPLCGDAALPLDAVDDRASNRLPRAVHAHIAFRSARPGRRTMGTTRGRLARRGAGQAV
ncbi:RHTO0S06e11298g1_1 [Rhodotorula toruloides]|uniref:RHTO0S06e11298g1_1 n=2 Tax=Rhodotorula toruloides TaxID=5286 RepID=A0A061AYB6_RHOTO|nr:uncharacterized protein RHTO_04384 [Rhodotorula toruloides NP11]EMS19383.1 hypothetical protein RHTO_04384 [Rhodotorula toruloides NP11]KAJ8293600.1 hypothetical protein OF846_003599 [Rhodotorula toruloides]CDR42235.1 RHTO0S06e11298g1_1 [Rhodotorula toruloides]